MDISLLVLLTLFLSLSSQFSLWQLGKSRSSSLPVTVDTLDGPPAPTSVLDMRRSRRRVEAWRCVRIPTNAGYNLILLCFDWVIQRQ
jgi:hypothetical protein